MVGKFFVGQPTEATCNSIAEKVADLALSADFKQRAMSLTACLHPQLFACISRLMVNELMSLLPVPQCEEDAYGADHLANFHDLLWNFVLIPLLMTENMNCANLFVRLFTVREYGSSAGHIDVSEMRIKELFNSVQSNLFFIKGQSLRGCDADDHFLTVSLFVRGVVNSICESDFVYMFMCNFRVLRIHLIVSIRFSACVPQQSTTFTSR